MTVADALRAVAAHIEAHSNNIGWSGREFPTGEQRSAKTAAFAEIARDLQALANASTLRRVRPDEYDALKHRWQELRFAIPDELAIAAAGAITASGTA